MVIIIIVIGVIYGGFWGCVTQAIIKNKGYRQNWFWWGFFFGFFACIVALTKPDVRVIRGYQNEVIVGTKMSSELLNIEKMKKYKELLDDGIITYDEFKRKKQELLNL